MRYLLPIASTVLLLWGQAPAPTGGDACGYRWYTHQATVVDSTPTYSWVNFSDLTNPQLLTGLADDNFAGPISLPSSFVYYWNSYTKVYVGSNGYITFRRGATVASGANPYFFTFPNTALPNEWLGAYVADLTFTDNAGNPIPGAKLYYGTDAQGRFVITWDSVPYWNGSAPGQWSGRNSFQIILNPADSSITLQYRRIDAGYHSSYGDGNYNVVGMENITGQSGLNIASRWPVPDSLWAIKIWHPGSIACTATDVQADWSLTERGEGIFVRKNGAAPTLQAGVLNTGNQVINNQVRSVLRIQGPGNATTEIYRDTVFVQPPFNPGSSFVSTYTKPFNSNRSTPTSLSTGNYRATHIVAIVGGGDTYSGNNQYQAELVICDSATSGPTQGRYILRYDDGNWDPANDDFGGIGFAHGMSFVAPEDLQVEAISVDVLYEDGGANNYPIALWVYAYDPISGAVGALLDSVGIDVADLPSGTLLNTFQGQPSGTFPLRRYQVPLTTPLSLSAGQGIAVGFLTLAPANATTIGNSVVADAALPISRRALEGIAGVWAPSRELDGIDYAVGLIARVGVSTSLPVRPSPQSWDFAVYPNPTTEPPVLRFDLPKEGPVHLRIVDTQGRLVWEEIRTLPTSSYKFQLPFKLPAGTYLIGATYEGWTKGQRLVVQ